MEPDRKRSLLRRRECTAQEINESRAKKIQRRRAAAEEGRTRKRILVQVLL